MIIGAKRAILLMLSQKVDMVEKYQEWIHSMRLDIPLPSVVRLKEYARLHRKEIVLSRKNILRRDNHTCQYCGINSTRMTIDHIIPKQKGGLDTWENLITACVECNSKKGNQSLHEAGMILRSKPKRPSVVIHLQKNVKHYQKMWRPYLFMEKN